MKIRSCLFTFLSLMFSLSPGLMSGQDKFEMTVSQDGTGDYVNIQSAIDACKAFPDQRIIIHIRNGVYREKVVVPACNNRISVIGENSEKTIISYGDFFRRINRGRNSTFYTYTFLVEADDFFAENLTFENSAGPVGQAVALHVNGNRCVFRNCRILGNQDSLYTDGSYNRQYFKDCYIQGTTDFIFGSATVLFDGCEICSKANSYITAASTTKGKSYGFVFMNCRITAVEGIDKVYLGRPWRDYANVVFINCYLGRHILPEGWADWAGTERYKTAFFAEYGNTGPGSSVSKRVSWSHQISKKEASKYTINNILSPVLPIEKPVEQWITGEDAPRSLPANLITDKLFSFAASSNRIEGYLGEKIDLVINKRIKSQDADYLVEPFRHKNETHLWQSEFWGKWMQSAIASYNYNRDPEMLKILEKSVKGLLATQMPSGYIGNYSDSARLQQWDIWGTKYTLLGLLAYYDLTGDKASLDGAVRLADNLLIQVGPGKVNIVKTGNYRGMPSSSILEPVIYLYRRTGDTKYLDFAKYIVEQWETEDGPKLISSALKGVAVSERFPHPDEWWSYDNGQKAYEMMSCYDGLLELYRMTGEPSYLKAAESAVKNIIESEINIAGSGTAFECFYKGAKYQTEPTYHTMETCVTMTWMKLCFNLLCLTENPVYADQIEKSTYNALLASLKGDGSQIAKYSPLGGIRHAGEQQCGMDINCCNANGPRAFMMLPRFVVMGAKNEICINLYGQSESVVQVNNKNKVSINQVSDYPVSGNIEINVYPEKTESFVLAFRIPEWSKNTFMTINGNVVSDLAPGTYKKVTRIWNKSDKVVLKLDMTGRLITLNGYQAIRRGPVVLARDTRFGDGFIYESAVVQENSGTVDLMPSVKKPADIWMSFTAHLVLGTDLEGDFRNPKSVNFCDFASAGNTWGEDSRYRVWIPKTLNVMKADYKAY